jgi:DNA (cytosine-5)-methyltransferase 1
MAIVAIDLFCGCGGVTYGLTRAGVMVALGIDIDEGCRFTFKLNNPGTHFLAADIRDVPARALLKHACPLTQSDFLLVAACAPCQPFSPQNRYKDRASDRAILGQVERILRELRPDFIFLENVMGIQMVPGFSAFRRLLRALYTLKYKVDFRAIDAVSYGVPQRRRRLVLLASAYRKIAWPEQTHGFGPELQPPITVRDAIAKYPPLLAGETHPTVPNHVAARLSPRNLERIRATTCDGGSRTEWPKGLSLSCHDIHNGHEDVYGRLRWDAPAPTLTTKCTSISNGRFGHPEQDRAISAREAAALQGFNDGFVFYGGLGQVSTQIGNSVPPTLAEKFGTVFIAEAEALGQSKKKRNWASMLGAR